MSGKFKYQNLIRSRREIRLLELLPTSHHLSKFRPACRIFHASLDENPSFLALSYVWGNRSDTTMILVDKRPFRVTRNLFEAIISLRETEKTTIWIDAICINQYDDEEKGWQVGLMGKIYRQACGVLAWLGAPAENSDTVMDYLNVLGGKAEVCGLHTGPGECMRIWRAMTTMPSYMDDPHNVVFKIWLDGRVLPVSKYALERLLHSISGWESHNQLLPIAGLKRLFRRAWWGRVWVLQEITLPERAYFVCGTKRITRRRFRAAFNAYYALWSILALKKQQQPLTSYQWDIMFVASHRTHVMLSMSNIYRTGTFPLVALLRATCVGNIHHLKEDGSQHLESTDPRDKIFALLGLARDKEKLELLGVFPDYTKSKEEIYATTMVALLQQGYMSMLSLCGFSGKSNAWPSWVPDWSLPMKETLQDVEPDHLTLHPKFNASGLKTESHVIVSKRSQGFSRISVMGNIYDKVLEVGDVPRFPPTGTCIFPIDWLYEILRLTYDAKNIYANFSERLQAVVRSSHAAIGYGEDVFLEKISHLSNALPIFKSGLPRIERQDIKKDLRGFLANIETVQLLRSKRADPSQLMRDLMRISPRRSPFVTEKGHLGLSSQYIKPGDLVAVVGGAQVPFILRKRDSEKYEIIGEAYVDGIMNGEAVKDCKWEYVELV